MKGLTVSKPECKYKNGSSTEKLKTVRGPYTGLALPIHPEKGPKESHDTLPLSKSSNIRLVVLAICPRGGRGVAVKLVMALLILYCTAHNARVTGAVR